MIERFITTDISASILASLLGQGWTLDQVAKAVDAPLSFVRGVQARKQVFAWKDIQRLARDTGQTAEFMTIKAIRPGSIKPELRELFATTKDFLELSSSIRAAPPRKSAKKRRSRTKAA